MPARTTPKQRIVALVRELWKAPGSTVTESKHLVDHLTREDSEVDVVVEGIAEGDIPYVISFEVIEHGRAADVTWINTMVGKHQHLPTTQLVLVSWSGFSKRAYARAQQLNVLTLFPQTIYDEEANPKVLPGIISTDWLQLLPNRVCALVTSPAGNDVDAPIDAWTEVYDEQGAVLMNCYELKQELFETPEVSGIMLDKAAACEEGAAAFEMTRPVPPGRFLHRTGDNGDAEVWPLKELYLSGECGFVHKEMDLEVMEMQDRIFMHTTVTLLGVDAVWVATLDEQNKLRFAAGTVPPSAAGSQPNREARRREKKRG